MSSTSDSVFRTFCHISEYGDDGYENLHRMVATSSPVVLWAPSSVQLTSAYCRLSAKDYVHLIENRTIRVIGRERWILSRAFRNDFPWAGGAWTPVIDDAVRSIALNDQDLPLDERRVAIADDERGDTWATRYVEENPTVAQGIVSALTAPEAARHFPAGVVETAMRYDGSPTILATRIVRDAYNHDAAIAYSGSRTPFLLSPRESHFHLLLESVRAASDVEFSQAVSTERISSIDFAALTLEVLAVLRSLEQAKLVSVRKFVESNGHALLTMWVKELCDSAVSTQAGDVQGEVLARLRREFDAGRLENSWMDILGNWEMAVGSVGTAASVVESSTSGVTVLGAIGLAAGAYSVGQALAKKAGLASVEVTGQVSQDRL